MNSIMTLSQGSIETYIANVKGIPRLTKEEEIELATKLRDNDDRHAASTLVLSQLYSVLYIAGKFSGYGLPYADLIQEGNVGLMKAVKAFDLTKKVRLYTFALHWIRAEIVEYILRNSKIVKIATTKAQRKLFFNLRKYRTGLTTMTQSEVDSAVNELKVPEHEVRKMESRLFSDDSSYDSSAIAETSISNILTDGLEPAKLIEAEDCDLVISEQLSDAMTILDDRKRDIILSRWLSEEKSTLGDLAVKYGVSAERIRQLEKQAFNTLRDRIGEL